MISDENIFAAKILAIDDNRLDIEILNKIDLLPAEVRAGLIAGNGRGKRAVAVSAGPAWTAPWRWPAPRSKRAS